MHIWLIMTKKLHYPPSPQPGTRLAENPEDLFLQGKRKKSLIHNVNIFFVDYIIYCNIYFFTNIKPQQKCDCR